MVLAAATLLCWAKPRVRLDLNKADGVGLLNDNELGSAIVRTDSCRLVAETLIARLMTIFATLLYITIGTDDIERKLVL